MHSELIERTYRRRVSRPINRDSSCALQNELVGRFYYKVQRHMIFLNDLPSCLTRGPSTTITQPIPHFPYQRPDLLFPHLQLSVFRQLALQHLTHLQNAQ